VRVPVWIGIGVMTALGFVLIVATTYPRFLGVEHRGVSHGGMSWGLLLFIIALTLVWIGVGVWWWRRGRTDVNEG
jgi:hypothetical protein